jgi:hypothetical protein
MNKITENKAPIFVSLKSICNELGVSRSTIFRVINTYKLKYKTEIVPGKHLTILGSYVFEKNIFIEWFRSIYVVPIKNIKPVDLFKHQKLSKLNGANHAA